jgi:hypothetical protein
MEGQKWRASEKKPVKLSLAEDVITHETAFFEPVKRFALSICAQ